MDKCINCPLGTVDDECYGGKARLCFLLDPDDKRFNPGYAGVFIKQSLVMAGKVEFEAPDVKDAPPWARPLLERPAPAPTPVPAPATPPPEDRPPVPSVWQQARNLGKAVVQHVAGGMRLVPREVFEERIRTCEACPHFDKGPRKCKICGCFMDLKASWADQQCPDDPPRWYAFRDAPAPPSPGAEPPKRGGCGCGEKFSGDPAAGVTPNLPAPNSASPTPPE